MIAPETTTEPLGESSGVELVCRPSEDDMVARLLDPSGELERLRRESKEAKVARDLLSEDLKELHAKHERLLRKQREANPEPDDELRHCLSIPAGFCSPHERPFAERELFDERMQEEVEKREGRNYILRVRLCNFESIPMRAKGSIGVDREWTADLILGSVKRFAPGVVQASYEIEVI